MTRAAKMIAVKDFIFASLGAAGFVVRYTKIFWNISNERA